MCSFLFRVLYGGGGMRGADRSYCSSSGPGEGLTLDRMLVHHRATHPHRGSDWDNVVRPVHLRCTSSGCGRNRSPQRNPTQSWQEHASSIQTVAWAGNPFFLPHQRYNKTSPHETMLFEHPLYISIFRSHNIISMS